MSDQDGNLQKLDSSSERLEVHAKGATTWDDMRQMIDAMTDLLKVANEAMNGDLATLSVRIPAITVYDGASYDKSAPWAEPCTDECSDSAPVFFNAPACVVFICRGCGLKACWRHSFTDKTGGWCCECVPANIGCIPNER